MKASVKLCLFTSLLMMVFGSSPASAKNNLVQDEFIENSFTQLLSEKNQRFTHLSNIQGLSAANVNSIVQDHAGFIWIATDDGLNRFDGHNITAYQYDVNEPFSLSDSEILSLLVDNNGVLWVGTATGLNRYNNNTDNFSLHQIKPKNNVDNRLNNKQIISMFEDAQARLWLGTVNKGIYVLSADRQTLQSYRYIKTDDKSLSDNSITAIAADHLGRLWVGTTQGLNLMVDKGKFQRFYHQKGNHFSLSNHYINSLYLDNKNNFWIGTDNGLNRLTVENSQFERVNYHQRDSNSLYQNIITSITQGQNNNLLIGTFTKGLVNYNPQTTQVTRYQNYPQIPYSLADNSIAALFVDKTGVTWVGTTSSGVDRLDFQINQFGHILSPSDNNHCLSGNKIYAILKDSHNELWVGVQDKGLHRIKLSTGQCELYQLKTTNLPAIKFDSVISLYEDRDANIWIGNMDEGVVRYNRSGDFFELFSPDSSKPNASISSLAINHITGDHQGNILISTYPRGFSYYNLNNKTFTNFKPDNSIASNDKRVVNSQIKTMTVDGEGNFWLGSASKGLQRFTPKTKAFKYFVADNVKHPFTPQKIAALAADNKGYIWLGTLGNGAYQFNPQTNSYKHFNINNGLISNSIYFIEIDARGNVWFSSSGGVSMLNTENQTFENYTFADGLQHNEFTTGGFYDGKTDKMWLAGINGYNHFSPAKLKKNAHLPSVSVIKFELFDEPVPISTDATITPLKKSIMMTQTLALDYNQNVFSFEFVAHHYADPSRNQYAYKLEGYEHKWHYVSANKRFARYTNLNEGAYVFRVKAANKDGLWNVKETKVKIMIATPPWKSWWAYCVYIGLFISIPFLIYYYRTKKIRAYALNLEKMIKTRTAELAQKNKTVESLLQQKNEEFANISHEFRTPLTLILGPLKALLNNDFSENTKQKMQLMQRNGYRLLRMLDQLLQMEKMKVQKVLNPTPHAVKPIISLISQSFEELAKERKIEITIKHIDEAWINFTPDAFEKIILNLLSNAVKYTQAGGLIILDARLIENNVFRLSIKDNGIGIAKEQQLQIFERYSRATEEHREKITGAGIGLALVKELCESHGGSVKVDSELGQGAQFTILLPDAAAKAPLQFEQSLNNEMLELELECFSNHQEAEPDILVPQESVMDDTRLNLLVIEDNTDMRNYIITSLSQRYHCIEAQNGKIGIEKAIETIPDLIICDIMMPQMDGYEVAKLLRSNDNTSHIPLIFLSARGDKQSRLKGWRELVDEYITKPFDEEELLLRVENLLSIRSLMSQRFNQEQLQPPVKSALLKGGKPKDSKPKKPENHQPSHWEEKERAYIEKLTATIENLYQEPKLKIKDIASKMFMSEVQFSRKLKNILNVTPNEYLRTFRLKKSAELLMKGKVAGDVAFSVGFSSHAYFSKCFKAYFGESPSDYGLNTKE